MQYLFLCRSLTYAQRGARMLERAGVTASVSRTPGELTKRGCGYCISVPERHYERALSVLNRGGLAPERVYRRRRDGALEEVGE